MAHSDSRTVTQGTLRVRLVPGVGWQPYRRIVRNGCDRWVKCTPCLGHVALVDFAIETKQRGIKS